MARRIGMSRLQLKLWLGVGLALSIAFVVVQLDHYRLARKQATESALVEARAVLTVLTATREVYQTAFVASGVAITELTLDLLPVHALARISQRIRETAPTRLQVKIATRESRHPDNRPDAIEADMLRHFEQYPDRTERLVPYTSTEGQPFLAYAQPIWTTAECLICHGDPARVPPAIRARFQPPTGYVEGDLRGIMSIKLPVEQIDQEALAFFLRSMRDHLLVFLTLFLAGGGLLQAFVIGKLRRIQRGTTELALGHYQERVPIEGRDEIADLAASFNRMAERIALRDKQLREAQAYAHLGYWKLDVATMTSEWTEEIYRLFGIPSETPAGPETLGRLIHPEDATRALEVLQTSIATANQYDMDYRIRRPDGEPRWVNCQGRPILDAEGRVTHLEGFVQDITARKAAEQRLVESEERLRVAMDSTRDAFIITDSEDDSITAWNPAAERLFGYRADEALGRNLHDLIAPKPYRKSAGSGLRHFAATGEGAAVGRTLELEGLRKDGSLIPIELSLSAMKLGKHWFGIGVARDITERNRARRALESERAFLQHVIDGIEDPLLVIGSDYRVLRMNRVARETALAAGLDETCLKCHQVSHRSELPCSGQDHPCPLEQVMITGLPCKLMHTHIGHNGQPRTVEVSASPLRDENDQILGIIEASRDITDQLALLEQLKEKDLSYAHLAQHDALTELPNRLLFADRLSQAIHGAHRRRTKLAVLFLDLDRFKHINESFDHTYGDAVLQAVARRLRELFREDDTVARMGGDEFAVILTDIRQDADAALVARKVLQLFEEPFAIHEHDLFLAASVGLSLYPEHGASVDELVRNADAAMHRAKDEGRNTYQYYAQELTAKAFERVLLETSLHQAIMRNELVLHYQPQVDLNSGVVRGMEALLRWRHPEMELISPTKFIPLAEESGMIIPIGEWVLREAARQMRIWLEAGLLGPDAQMSVNLSARQFDQATLIERIQEVLAETGLDPTALELEITESVVMQAPESSSRRLSQLRDLGVKVAIDDFGTGYSSLGYLKAFPLTKLKIDQSFVAEIPGDPNNAAITKAIIGLAHSLSLDVVAEGVETQEQRRFLMREGCRIGQGFLFARALSPEAFAAYLQPHANLDPPAPPSASESLTTSG